LETRAFQEERDYSITAKACQVETAIRAGRQGMDLSRERASPVIAGWNARLPLEYAPYLLFRTSRNLPYGDSGARDGRAVEIENSPVDRYIVYEL
jgi:hypothetical protein